MNPLNTITRLVGSVALLALAWTSVAAAQVSDPAVVGRAVVRTPDLPGGPDDLDAFLAAFLANEGIVLTPVDAIERVEPDPIGPVAIYLLEFDAEAQLEVGMKLDPEGPGGGAYVMSGALTWGELLYAGEASEGKTGGAWVASLEGGGFFNNQYAGEAINLDAAHENADGTGAVVAVIDTGVDSTHPGLAGLVLPGGYNFVENSTNTLDLADGRDNDDDGLVDEMWGHGTFVAGLIAYTAPGAKILPIVALNSDGVGDGFGVAKAIFFAIDQGVEVINLSLGSTYDSAAIELAMEAAISRGVVPVAAGGNQNQGEGDFEEFPAAKSDGFGVAAVDVNDVKAPFSNYNDKFLISAPGDSRPDAAFPDGFDPAASIYSMLPGGGYGVWEGTSFSTAFVSGAAAVIRSQHPEWQPTELTYNLIESTLALTATDIYGQNPQYEDDEELGAGRLDLGAAASLGGPAPTLGDLNGDGSVDSSDLAGLLGAWGETHSSADLNGDGQVGAGDLAILLGAWTG